MKIDRLIWNRRNTAHIARHNVSQNEVYETCAPGRHLARRIGQEKRGLLRYHVYGQTLSGRYLFIVLDRKYGATFYVVTARDMNAAEKKMFRRKGKK
ncbi:MAG: BrnT family toxin [Anaerolineae bacterium]